MRNIVIISISIMSSSRIINIINKRRDIINRRIYIVINNNSI
jgi:hypothetical protein